MEKSEFQKQKEKQLNRKDASFIGSVDEDIKKLVDLVNSNENYYTTSSCSGRFVLLKDSVKKKAGLFLWMTHKEMSVKEFSEALNKVTRENPDDLIYYKCEPALIVVACRTLEECQKLTDEARFIGFKKSGIISTRERFISEIIGTENIIFPIADKGKILVDEDFISVLVKESNLKLRRTWEKIEKLRKYFEKI